MKYWVTMDTSYNVYSVEEIDEALRDGETKDKNTVFAFPITAPLKDFLKGGVLRVTASGNLNIEVEADSEEEARRIAPMACLKKRVADLEESLRRSSQGHEKLMEEKIAILLKDGKAITTFESIIRSGELTISNTGRRIIGTWFDVAGEKEFEFSAGTNFDILMEEIKNTPVKCDDCY
jgi:hypothetical protein